MNFGSWIPQLFYDLIGRIIPGTVLMLMSFFLFPPLLAKVIKSFEVTGLSNTVFVLIAIVTSYILGVIVGGLAYAIMTKGSPFYILWKWLSKKIKDLNNSDNPLKKANSENETTENKSVIYDYILFHSPNVGSNLAKLSAERSLSRVLIIGVSIIVVVYFFTPFYEFCGDRFWTIEGVLLGVIVGLILFYRRILLRSKELMANNYDLIKERLKSSKDSE